MGRSGFPIMVKGRHPSKDAVSKTTDFPRCHCLGSSVMRASRVGGKTPVFMPWCHGRSRVVSMRFVTMAQVSRGSALSSYLFPRQYFCLLSAQAPWIMSPDGLGSPYTRLAQLQAAGAELSSDAGINMLLTRAEQAWRSCYSSPTIPFREFRGVIQTSHTHMSHDSNVRLGIGELPFSLFTIA